MSIERRVLLEARHLGRQLVRAKLYDEGRKAGSLTMEEINSQVARLPSYITTRLYGIARKQAKELDQLFVELLPDVPSTRHIFETDY